MESIQSMQCMAWWIGNAEQRIRYATLSRIFAIQRSERGRVKCCLTSINVDEPEYAPRDSNPEPAD